MILTEEEARTKWCPMARVAFEWTHGGTIDNQGFQVGGRPSSATVNRGADLSSHCNCIASECVMWVRTDNVAEPQHPTDATEPVYKVAGYCGLAGKP